MVSSRLLSQKSFCGASSHLVNIYYRANQVHIHQHALAQSPQDGDRSTLTSVQPDPPSMEQGANTLEEDPYGAHLTQPFVPNTVKSQTEQ